MSKTLNWGILGTGNIAKSFAKGVAGSRTGKIVAVGSRSKEKADAFGDEFKVPTRHGSYEALLADPQVQAVYIATPHPQHAEWTIKAAEAKKHILVEKPIGLNHYEAMAMVESARANDVFLMEAYMYRCHPQTAKLVELVKEKAIGDLRVIEATFSFHWPRPFNDTSRLTNNALGGGGILDVGGYTTTMARLLAGAATGKDFAEPTEFKAVGHLESTGVDGYALAVAKFPGEILARLATGVQLQQENVVRLFGTDGKIVVPDPWTPARDGGTVKIVVHKNGEKEPREIEVKTDEKLYGLEADTVARYVDQRQAASPAMSWADTLGNAKVIDQWKQQIGLVYESEKPANARNVTLANRPLKVSPKNNMKYGKVAGLDRKVSRLVMGVDNQDAFRHAEVIFDDYFERGGNTFDTAFVYGPVRSTNLGAWIKGRGVRNDVNVIVKGAHTPHCNPKDLSAQLLQSLDLLKIESAEFYIMHRDNPEIPVGEFVDVLNEHAKAGRIKLFGGSNWSLDRIAAANDYAKKKGLQPFSLVSNNFSLARLIEPMWAGCIASSDSQSRAWLTEHQLPLFAWSSQARGWFTDRAHRDKSKNDAETNRCWYSDDNLRRRDRAIELAAKRNVLPINVALAYVLCQPFPTFPLIGPRTLEETRTSLPALDVELTPADLKYLNLED